MSRAQFGRYCWSCQLPQARVRVRTFSATSSSRSQDDGIKPTIISPRWLSDTKARLGRCMTFGMSPELVDKAGEILHEINVDWRNLVAGTEGYLTDKRRAGLHRHSVVWGESDMMGHTNNVMYVRYAESGRTNWTRNIGQYFDVPNRHLWADLLTARHVGLILKSITIDFKFPMTWPDRISVYHKLRNRPTESTTSLVLDVLILSEGKQRAAAKCLEDVVVYDYTKGSKTALPGFMLDQFTQLWNLQEEAKRENGAKVEAIETRIRHLEAESWNRPDAKEDLGSAGSPAIQ